MYHVYSRNVGGSITQFHSADTRWQCEKFLRDLRRAGRMTHFYFISKLGYDRAVRRYVDKEL